MIGKTVSHYKIIEKLGGGGMGVVYRAEDTKLKRSVALKFLPPELTRDQKAKKRLIQEAQSASALDHPNICTIYEIDETEDEQLFIAMSFCTGGPLSNKIELGPLKIEEVIDIALQVGGGLSSAHKANVIHRDIKPENIMITDKNQVKIVDFGLARLVDQARITQEGAIIGTIAYMSPEQAWGEKVDHRSDIWSFGVILYEMLTARLAFKRDYEQATIYAIMNEEQEPITKIRSDVSIDLEKIVNKALSKSPEQRYQQIENCLVDLRRLKKGLERQQTFNQMARTMREEERKLAAIMFTDMVGYSAITQKNEDLALELLEEHRQILRPLFTQFGGREVETAGDAFFVEYSSALEAVRCAVEIQKTLIDRNKSVPEERQIKLRIGVHLGDVVHRGANVLGDGVNIAARIEPLAQSCGICVSQDVARQIQNKIDFQLKKIESSQLKNIKLPVDVYAVILPWSEKDVSLKSNFNLIRKRGVIIGGIAALILIFSSVFIWQYLVNHTIEKKSIAVLPFKNIGAEIENEYFSDGITEDIIAHLSTIDGLKVISRTSAMQYKNTDKNLKVIGNELNVANILEGSVRRDADKVRIVAQLIDAQKDEHLWSKTYDEQLTQIFAIQTAVAEKIVQSLRATISQVEKERLAKKSTVNIKAYDLYLKGRYHLNKRMPDDLNIGVKYFNQALEMDPQYALAYSGLADSYILIGNYNILPPIESFNKARDAALKALEIDEVLAEAHTSLAFVRMYSDWNWKDAEIEFKRALELDPDYAMANSLYASYLTALKRSDEAKVFRKHARELDPHSPAILLEEGLELYFDKKYDQTIEHCQKIIEMDPFLIIAYIPLSGAYIHKSMYDEAIEKLSKATWLSEGHPVAVAAIGYAYAVSGRREDAQNMIDLLMEKSQEEYVAPFWMAVVYAGLENENEVFSWLEKAYQQRDALMVFLDVFPIFDHLRNDPRYIDLLTKIGLRK